VNPTRRVIVLVAAVAAIAVTAALLPLGSLPERVARLGVAAPFIGTGLAAALLVALVPRTPISLACGLLFGPVTGTLCALAAALVAAAVTFAAGRWLGREFVARHTGRRLSRVDGWVTREGVLAVAAVRALPLGPYGLVGYAYGGSPVRVRDYAWGTAIAATPSAVSYAIVGAAVARPGAFDPLALIPLAVGLGLSAAVVIRARVVAARRRDRGDGGSAGHQSADQ
jgi:uncharacterized membrane protein YdjX (TVP38/TMEM64 family)